MKAYELTSWLEKKYPSDAAEDWDNVGLLAGDDTNEISHVFLALDLTEETLAEAIEDGADMIITHHPMIFSGEYDGNGKEIVKYYFWTHSFIPTREKMHEHIVKDKVPYDAWERQGFLEVTNTPIVDQGRVMRYVMEECEKYNLKIQCLCFDPANASKLMMDLSDEGYVVEEVFQSHKHLNEATQGFREQVFCKNVGYLPNPLLNYAMSNAVVRQNNGLIKIDKDATTKRIDPRNCCVPV